MRPFSSGESRVRFLKACFCELRGVTRGHGKSVRGQTRLGKAGLLPTCCGRPAGAAGDGVPGQRAAVALHLRICIRDFLFIYFFTCRECLFLKEFICTQLKTYPREPGLKYSLRGQLCTPFYTLERGKGHKEGYRRGRKPGAGPSLQVGTGGGAAGGGQGCRRLGERTPSGVSKVCQSGCTRTMRKPALQPLTKAGVCPGRDCPPCPAQVRIYDQISL